MKTKFTKKQRNTIYKRLLKEVNVNVVNSYEAFICWKLWIIIYGDLSGYGFKNCEEQIYISFPEWKTSFLGYIENKMWDYEKEQRVLVLNECIKLSA